MSRKLTKWKRRALLMATVGLCLGVFSADFGKEKGHKKDHQIRFDIQRLNERIMTAHRLLTTPHDVIHQRTDLQHVGQGGSWIHPIWVVEWEDCQGQYLCRTTWDAVNGKLLVAEHPVHRAYQSADRDSRSAITESWRWMEGLGISRDAQRWHLSSPPDLKARCWIVIWRAEGCRATVVMDRHTLDLNYLFVKEV